jgi:hypothetical protein
MQYQQMGFGFEALDPETGEVVPWDKPTPLSKNTPRAP